MSEDPWWKEKDAEEMSRVAQEVFDAQRLIKAGRATGDRETIKIGQARLRVAEGRATAEDVELLRK